MNFGLLLLKVKLTRIITLNEVDWVVSHQFNFSRIEEASALKLGRLIDSGSINIGCRQTA